MIEAIKQPDTDVLDELQVYLKSQPEESGVCSEHDPRWLSVLESALSHVPYALIAREDSHAGTSGASQSKGPIRGYLPLCDVKSRLFGRFLVSLPYLNRAGVVAMDESVASELIAKAVELATELDVQYLELRHSETREHDSLGSSRSEKVRMVLELPPDGEALFKAIGPKVRNLVRKGDKHNLEIRWGRSVLDDFYRVFSINMRDLGTPVYPKQLFGDIVDKFGSDADLAVVYLDSQPVSGALLVHDSVRGMTQVPSASSLREFNHTSCNMWMYHQLLLRAMGLGLKDFDFGRSSEGSGTYRFKKQWGAQPHPTVWQHHVRAGDVSSMRPDSAKNQRRVAMWQKLPVWLTRLVGPRIVRGIP
jgi:serine/alanine adding enzyme